MRSPYRNRFSAQGEAQRRAEAAEMADYYSGAPIPGDVGDGTAKPTCCGLCKRTCTTDDYCCGCKTVVCERCNHADSNQHPTGPHAPEDHLPRPKALS